MKSLKRRILEISYERKLSHLGSCLTAVDIIDEIFKKKRPDEKFVLSCGHAGLALYVVLEKYGGKNAETIYAHHGTHPDRCEDCGIDCSTGSLGHGIAIAVGMALADRKKNVYCLISDGECAEGSVWEAIRIWKREKLRNLRIYLNFNGYSAYQKTSLKEMPTGVKRYITNYDKFPFLMGLDAHYCTLKKEDYEAAIR
jgi:transketolase